MDVSLSAACRWDWCARTFSDLDSLRVHVEQDHIAAAVPVRRKDVPLLRRAEEGTSIQESVMPRAWGTDTDGSQSFVASHRVERAVMTDAVLPIMTSTTVQAPIPAQFQTPRQVLPPRSGASTPAHIPKITPKENARQMTFSEMRGTPSPVPSPIPSSPGTTAIINKMTHNTLFPVTPRRSLHGTPNARLSPKSGWTPKSRTILPYTFHTPPVGDGGSDAGDMRAANAMDNDTSVDIVESQLQSLDDIEDAMDVKSTMSTSENFLNSQWQPQSQLPLPGSVDNSTSLPTTIDPSQLHAPLSFVTVSQPLPPFIRSRNDRNPSTSPSRRSTSKASQDPGTPRPSSSAHPPPSPSTLDISNITNTNSQDSILQTPSRGVFQANSQASPISRASVPAAGASGLSQPASETQGSNLYVNELPFDVGFGYGYGDGASQPLQTQVPLPQSSLNSSEWSQS